MPTGYERLKDYDLLRVLGGKWILRDYIDAVQGPDLGAQTLGAQTIERILGRTAARLSAFAEDHGRPAFVTEATSAE